jgi:hypothetical protein
VLLNAVDRTRPAIPLEDCVQGNLYFGYGRNIDLTVLRSLEHGDFVGVREKFGYTYLDSEFYRGEKSGTYVPRRDLGPLSAPARAMFDEWVRLERETWRLFEAMREQDKLERPDDWFKGEVQKERASLPSHVAHAESQRAAGKAHSRVKAWLNATATRRARAFAKALGIEGVRLGELLADGKQTAASV